VRPGAVRVEASSSDPDVTVSAFRNRDGSLAVQAINGASAAAPVRLALGGRATAYLTDAAHDLAPTPHTTLPPRAMVTYVVRPDEH
jgi:glucuronoarabinoxylan endo-1,4-beta-xylanase